MNNDQQEAALPTNTWQGNARAGWLWGGGDQFVQRGLGMAVSLVLARLLEPAAFGLIASVAILINVAQQLTDAGIGQRVLQKADVGEEEYNALIQQVRQFNTNTEEQIPYLTALAARLRDYLQT